MTQDNWVNQTRKHWQEFQPTRYRALKKAGILEQVLKDAAEQTHLEMNQLEERGFQHHEAWEMTRELYLFLPEETTSDEEVNELAALVMETNRVLNELQRDSDLEEQ